MNYSTLLQRSVDFDDYAHGIFGDVDTELGLYDNYPDELDRQLTMSLIERSGSGGRRTATPTASRPTPTATRPTTRS